MPVPRLTWNRLKNPAMARHLIPRPISVPRLSRKQNRTTKPRLSLKGTLRLKGTPSRLPRPGAGAPPDSLALDALERHHILKVLEYAKGNKTEAARLLGIGIATLYRKIDEYGIGR